LICLSLRANAVPLENWRFPFYRIAAERGEYRSSPSGMFWDDLRFAPAFDSSLWPDSAKYAANHVTLEPALGFEFASDSFITQDKYNLHFDMLADFRFKKLTVRAALDADRSYQSDPLYPGHLGRGAAGRIEEAYIQYAGTYGFARLGRLCRVWGPFPDRSILLSNNPYSYDAFDWQLHVPFLEFRHMVAAFPDKFSKRDTDSLTLSRFLTAHALNFIFGKWASIGISESVVFGRQNGFPDFQYINPVSIYTVINTNQEGVGNLMLGLQGWAHPFTEKVTLKGQVVFDDFQIDSEDSSDLEPTHWAFDVGASARDFLPFTLKHHAAVEYRYLSRWMYTVTVGNTARGERYSYAGKSLGYSTIDGDEFKASVSAIGNNYWAATVGGGFMRKDTNTLYTQWPANAAGALGYTEEAPLSERTNLETTISAFIEAHGYFRNFCALHAGLENRWIKNKGNVITNEYEYDPRFSLTITGHFSNFFLTFP
jgi:hypothetical protein